MLGGVLNNRSSEPEESRSGWEWFASDTSSQTWSGMAVTPASSMQLLAVHGSVRLISEGIATLPIDTYREEGDERVPTRPPLWLEEPTPTLNIVDWLSQVLTSLLLDGNSYSWSLYDSSGTLRELWPIADELVSVKMRNKVIKEIYVDGKLTRKGQVLHIPAMMRSGSPVGLSPIENARQAIGLGLAAMEFGAGYFDRDGNMPGVIELPRVANPETMLKMATQWKRKRTRAGKGMPGVIDDGGTWKPTGVTSEQAQFLQTRKYSSAEIAGQLFMLDPSELGIPVEGSSLTYANLDQRNVRRVQVTYLPWIVRLEKALSALLPRKQFVRLNVDGILRGDMKTRYESYKIGLENKFLTVDEVREMEDRRPLTDEEKEALEPAPPPPMAPAAAAGE